MNLSLRNLLAPLLCTANLIAVCAEPLHPTLNGRIMCGYQGWFRTERDPTGRWVHWVRRKEGAFAPTTDYLPDISEAAPEELCPLPLAFKEGAQALVFSSDNPATVNRHFRWMRDYGIDGAFVQRFPVSFYSGNAEPSAFRDSGDRVLRHCRDAAREHGRACALMFDLSGLRSNAAEVVIRDFQHLTAAGTLDLAADAPWQRHNGKPLIALWGVGFDDNRKYDLTACERIVDFFREQGLAVLLGVPFYWRELKRDSVADEHLHAIIRKADIVHSWSVGRYRDTAGVRHAESVWTEDVRWCGRDALLFMPVVFPGFSWLNLKGEAGAIPRRGGRFLWEQFVAAQRSGAGCVYVAMFDETDEGTQIFKTALNPPQGETFHYRTFEGEPADHYLRLTGAAAGLFRAGAPLPAEMP